ncbi:MAG: KilA-N domain-containing protein [Bacteroidaceae bacterium]|nr:KilA-N domain-containing protein [Bacteroidaceae bacterium]
MAKIIVQNTQIMVIKQDEDDYIGLTDMLRAKDGEFFFSNWLRNRTAIGDAENTDAESGSRRFYALRLGKFNALGCNISA